MNITDRKPMSVRPGTDASIAEGITEKGIIEIINRRIQAALQKTFFPEAVGVIDAATRKKFPILWNQSQPAFSRTPAELQLLWDNPVQALLKDEALFLDLPAIVRTETSSAEETANTIYVGQWPMWWRALRGVPLATRGEIPKPHTMPPDSTRQARNNVISGKPKPTPPASAQKPTKAELAELKARYTSPIESAAHTVSRQLCQYTEPDGAGGKRRCLNKATMDGRCVDHLIF